MSHGIGFHIQNLAIFIQFVAMCMTTWRAFQVNYREWGCPPKWQWRCWLEGQTWKHALKIHDQVWRRDFSTTLVLIFFTYFRWYRLQLRMDGAGVQNWWLSLIDIATTLALLWMLWEHRGARRPPPIAG